MEELATKCYNTGMRILSGIRATGALHIGNYLGAIQQWIKLQEKTTAFYMIADLHAITTPFDAKQLPDQVRVVAAEYLAAGLDPKKATLFVQSRVPAHSGMAWILNTITPFGELRRMTQWKDKTPIIDDKVREIGFNILKDALDDYATETKIQSLYTLYKLKNETVDQTKMSHYIVSNFKDSEEYKNAMVKLTDHLEKYSLDKTSAGLINYPILMAADILLYHADRVPVGDDQVQHVELARALARKFNRQFGKTLVEPQPLLTEGKRILSLRDPSKKMSKTNDEPLYLSDEPDVIHAKLARAVTATSGGGNNPGVQNLFVLLRAFASTTIVKKFEAAEKDGSIRYSDLKHTLATAISDHFTDFRAKRKKLLSSPKTIDKILEQGAKKANAVAEVTLAEVYKKTGLR